MSEQHAPTSNQSDAPRRVDLAIARIDAWTVMKVSFLLSVAFGIAIVIATIVLWFMLDAMHVFSTLESFLQEIGAGKFTELLEYVRLPPHHRLRHHRRSHQRGPHDRDIDAGGHALQRGRVPGRRRQSVPHGRVIRMGRSPSARSTAAPTARGTGPGAGAGTKSPPSTTHV